MDADFDPWNVLAVVSIIAGLYVIGYACWLM